MVRGMTYFPIKYMYILRLLVKVKQKRKQNKTKNDVGLGIYRPSTCESRGAFPHSLGVSFTCSDSPRSGSAARRLSPGNGPSFYGGRFPKNEPPTSELLEGWLKRQIPGLYLRLRTQNPEV